MEKTCAAEKNRTADNMRAEKKGGGREPWRFAKFNVVKIPFPLTAFAKRLFTTWRTTCGDRLTRKKWTPHSDSETQQVRFAFISDLNRLDLHGLFEPLRISLVKCP